MTIDPWVPVFYETQGMTIQDWITIAVGFGGAVVGAIVGGFISSRQIRQAHDLQLQKDAADRETAEKAGLVAAQFQASLILTDVIATLRSIDESLELANERGLTSQPLFMRILPIIGNMETPHLDLHAIAPLVAARENDLVRAYIEAHAKHSVLRDALRRFDAVKQDLNERVSPYMTFENGAPGLNMTDDRFAQLKPFFDGADSLAKHIRAMASELREIASTATFGIGPVAKKIYNDDKFPTLVPAKTGGT
jgi:hypothetical protein